LDLDERMSLEGEKIGAGDVVRTRLLVQSLLRAAELVLTHGAKAIEIEDVEARVSELERAAEETKNTR
jgi:hypothetical protein